MTSAQQEQYSRSPDASGVRADIPCLGNTARVVAAVRFSQARPLTGDHPPANYVNVINIHMEMTYDDWGCGDAGRLRQARVDCRHGPELHPVLARGPRSSGIPDLEWTHGMWTARRHEPLAAAHDRPLGQQDAALGS